MPADQPATTKYNSVIEFATVDGVDYIDKKLRLPFSSRAQAEEVRQQILLQRLAFEKIHVPISKLVDIDLSPSEAGFWIKIREVFAGQDFMAVVSTDNLGMYLERLLDDVFTPLLNSTKEDYLPAGIDPILRNFVYDSNKGEFCYVDFMPPKVFYKGKYTQEIPECTDPDFYNVRVFNHNLRAGVVYVMYVNLVREFPSQLPTISGRLQQFLGQIGQPQLYHYIETSPLYRATSASQVRQVVENLSDWKLEKYFLLREIANWLNFMKPELLELKQQVYKLSSQERDPNSPDYGRLADANFAAVKKLLLQGIDQL